MLYRRLKDLEESGRPIGVLLVGSGAMGVGICYQVAHTPGMRLRAVTDIKLEAARKGAEASGLGDYTIVKEGDPFPKDDTLVVSLDTHYILDHAEELGIDVLVEATNTIGDAAAYSMKAIEKGLHVVLMNAEVDLAVGPILKQEADKAGVVLTSDAGDQHGVLAKMIDEIRVWDFDIVMAGNIKGFLNRYATAASLEYEARIRDLDPWQCCAYTDGSKLCVEMAIIGNAENLVPHVPGMEGPRAADVREVFHLFDFDKYGDTGVVDYILGAQPGGGVYVIGKCDDPLQMDYMKYYKMGNGPYYLFYRPYHLCHVETTHAIAQAMLNSQELLQPYHGRINDVYAYAKRDIEPGEEIHHAVGGDHFYGLIETVAEAEGEGRVPLALVEPDGANRSVVKRPIRRDQPLTADDIDFADTYLRRLFEEQLAMEV